MLNRVILIGRLANEPELKYTPSGVPVTTFRLAVDRPQSAEARQQGAEKQADSFDMVCWRQNAEFAANYLTKGRLTAIEGKLQTREYVTGDGQRRKTIEVIVETLRPLDKNPESNMDGNSAATSVTAPRPAATPNTEKPSEISEHDTDADPFADA